LARLPTYPANFFSFWILFCRWCCWLFRLQWVSSNSWVDPLWGCRCRITSIGYYIIISSIGYYIIIFSIGCCTSIGYYIIISSSGCCTSITSISDRFFFLWSCVWPYLPMCPRYVQKPWIKTLTSLWIIMIMIILKIYHKTVFSVHSRYPICFWKLNHPQGTLFRNYFVILPAFFSPFLESSITLPTFYRACSVPPKVHRVINE